MTAAEFRSRVIIGLLVVIMAVVVGAALRATYVVTMPLAYAFFLAMLVRPVQLFLNRHLPYRLQWLSLVATMLLIVTVIAIGVGMIWLSIGLLRRSVSEYSEVFKQYWVQFAQYMEAVGIPISPDFFQSEAVHGFAIGVGTFILTSIWSLLGLLVIIFFLSLLMLLEVRDWQRKIRRALRGEQSVAIVETLNVVAEKIRHYLLVQSFVGAVAGTLAGIWLWLIGVDFALLWAIVFFMFNYIPHVGPVMGGIPPVIMALIQFNFAWALLASSGLLLIQQVMGNVIEPRMQGRALQMSPAFLVIAIFMWGWIWGVPGAIAAVPMTVAILITFAHIPLLRPVALLLSRSVEEPIVETTTEDG